MKTNPVARALVSVSDKRGIVAFCRGLAALDIEILSTGGTARQLGENGIAVTEVSAYTGFPEMMDGRVKTLHPKIHGAILGRRGVDDEVMAAHDIRAIDLVAVNLYPFEETVAEPGCKLEQAIESIDIGGPALLRAAAKNHRDTTVLVDPEDYGAVLEHLQRKQRRVPAPLRFDLAVKAFEHTAGYDGAIANHLGARIDARGPAGFPRTIHLQFSKKQALRYGENPHQSAAFYAGRDPAGIAGAVQLQGRELSFNNIADGDAALECARQFEPDQGHACVIVKHANPCGVAVDADQLQAYRRAFATDPESAYGGIIAFNQPLRGEAASAIVERQFAEVIIAPEVSAEAKEAVAAKENIRLLECARGGAEAADGRGGAEVADGGGGLDHRLDYKRVNGGLLVQRADLALNEKLEVVTERAPDDAEMEDLLFAWKVAKFVKSNAIVYAGKQATIGIGAGQMSRVNSARIAGIKARHAGLQVRGAVMASDAFFPFRDGLDSAAEAGVRAVIQPGGSMRDDEVIDAADEHGIAMVFTGMRHFRH